MLVTTVSAQPISTTNAERKPAETVVNAGADISEMFGGWKCLKSVSTTADSNGRGSVDGKARAIRLGRESMSRYLSNKIVRSRYLHAKRALVH